MSDIAFPCGNCGVVASFEYGEVTGVCGVLRTPADFGCLSSGSDCPVEAAA